jgi:Zn-dependent M28 family amino/carboxypeptidase
MRIRSLWHLSLLSLIVITVAFVVPANAQETHPSITADGMGARIAVIQGRRSGTFDDAQRAKLNEVAGYVRSQLASDGLSVSEDPVSLEGYTFPNIVGTLRGTTCPEKTFIVGAHYDGVSGGPAADDNASGIAGMLEIARALSKQPLPASVDFAAFSFEESGLIGSTQMAEEAKSAGRELVGMFSLEMIGYTCDVPGCQSYPVGIAAPRPTGDFLAVIANAGSETLLSRFSTAAASIAPDLPVLPLAVPGNGETLPDVRRSDHAPFWDRGYQALMVTDTANLRNPNYHQAGDTLDTLNLDFAAKVANASAETVVEALTADENGDGRADVCGPAQVNVTAQPTVSEASPESKRDGSGSSSIRWILAVAAAGAVGVALAGGLLLMARRRS